MDPGSVSDQVLVSGLYSDPDQAPESVKIDCVFPVLHGENGEDGSIQGLMQIAGIPCVGPSVAASASSMDKSLTKLLVGETGVRQANWYLARRDSILNRMDRLVRDIEQGGEYPLFVKPANAGSSVGITKVKTFKELPEALRVAFAEDTKAIVEETIEGREMEVAVLGNGDPQASCVGEIISANEF